MYPSYFSSSKSLDTLLPFWWLHISILFCLKLKTSTKAEPQSFLIIILTTNPFCFFSKNLLINVDVTVFLYQKRKRKSDLPANLFFVILFWFSSFFLFFFYRENRCYCSALWVPFNFNAV